MMEKTLKDALAYELVRYSTGLLESAQRLYGNKDGLHNNAEFQALNMVHEQLGERIERFREAFKPYGVEQKTNNLFTGPGKRAQYEIAPGLTMAALYKIFHDRLEYCRVNVIDGLTQRTLPLEKLTDIDVLCQNACCEVEKALGIYPNVEQNNARMGNDL